jgi:hypothetical protein
MLDSVLRPRRANFVFEHACDTVTTVGSLWPQRFGSVRAMPWGPEKESKVWTGLDVLSSLVDAVNDLADAPRRQPHKECPPDLPVVIGCSPWFSDPDLAAALARVHSCVVMTKPERLISQAVRRLQGEGEGVWKPWLRGLDSYGRRNDDGTIPTELLGNADSAESGHDLQFGPVRVAGWLRAPIGPHDFPLVHAKVAVLGFQQYYFADADGYGEYEVFGFRPIAAWWGSANFTKLSRVHPEVATLSTDPNILLAMENFVLNVLRISEPLSATPAPAPSLELVPALAWEPSPEDLAYLREQEAFDERDEH